MQADALGYLLHLYYGTRTEGTMESLIPTRDRGLPAVYANESQAETLEVILKDSVSGVKVSLLYGVLPEFDVITRSVKVENAGVGKVVLEKVQSACLDFINGTMTCLHSMVVMH